MTPNYSLFLSLIKKYKLIRNTKYISDCYIPDIPQLTFDGAMIKYEPDTDSIWICEPDPSCTFTNKFSWVTFRRYGRLAPWLLDDRINNIIKHIHNNIFQHKQDLLSKKIKDIQKDFT